MIAPLDRRIEVLAGSGNLTLTRVSDLRNYPFVVLLGEPGSGKSSVLQTEAALAGRSVMKVREWLIGIYPTEREPLFLDALDEFRIDGQEQDKVLQLAKALRDSSVPRWRVTCRSEDWRKGADLTALSRACAGQQIVVAKLQPLDEEEERAILVSLGETAPDAFLAKASTRGASSLLGSPLRLKLLHTVVRREKRWPATRYELFSAAAQSLAHEHNDYYRFRSRTAPTVILAAAERASLLMLLKGSLAFWRSNSEPPNEGRDSTAFLTAHQSELDYDVVSDMLDTGLFTGEGEAFEPVHRTIAEFLGARALAKAVRGDHARAAFPLSRALAMITGPDSLPPADLRGLYAWFACHLSQLGERSRAKELIERDAATVLFYSDAAILNTEERRTLLLNLDRNDPYFRASESPDSAIAGLAQRDLESEFRQILQTPTVESHHLFTVFEALTGGEPIAELRPALRSIVLDRTRPEWHRWRAADAWLNGPEASARALFNELASEPPSAVREALRLHLAVRFTDTLSVHDIQSLLADFEQTRDDHTVGRLIEFAEVVSRSSVVQALFEEPLLTHIPDPAGRPHSVELEHALDAMLAAAIRSKPQLSAEQLWKWVNHVRRNIWLHPQEKTQDAIREWIEGTTAARRSFSMLC